jgi:S-adenosylmethionine synthetase
MKFQQTAESVSEGHSDKVCDLVADAILDAYLKKDPNSRVAVEVLCKEEAIVLGGEIHSGGWVDREKVVRATIREIGYVYDDMRFHAERVRVVDLINFQGELGDWEPDRRSNEVGAGDQGVVFGFATKETESLMPLPITLAHAITRGISQMRQAGETRVLRPDAKAQVTIAYENRRAVAMTNVVVSVHHEKGVGGAEIAELIREAVLPRAVGDWVDARTRILINPAGPFDVGGPDADCGVTGRKTAVDTYGGQARHGGGALSGKDATKVDRSGAYYARFVARQIVLRGLASEVEVQIAYAIGVPDALAVSIDTKGTGDDRAAEAFALRFDYRPGAIIRQLALDSPIFTGTTNYGHFGKKGVTWEI